MTHIHNIHGEYQVIYYPTPWKRVVVWWRSIRWGEWL